MNKRTRPDRDEGLPVSDEIDDNGTPIVVVTEREKKALHTILSNAHT